MPNISKRFTPDTSPSGGTIATAALNLKNPVDRKIFKRWTKRWEPMLRFQRLGEDWVEKFRVEHAAAMKTLLRVGLDMRIIEKNDFDDLELTSLERKDLIRLYLARRKGQRRHESLDGLRD